MQYIGNPGFKKPLRLFYLACLLFLSFVLTSCATVPGQTNHRTSENRHADDSTIDIGDVISDPSSFARSPVHWGGVIQGIENRENETWIEILERPLNRSGQPQLHSLSHGRFIAVVPVFLDPVDYRKGRAITVSGNMSGVQTGSIGNTKYDFPRVLVADYQLWSPSSVIAGRRSDYRPYRGSISIGIGFGGFNSFRFGYKNRGYLSLRSGHYRGLGYRHKRGRFLYRHGLRNRPYRR